MCHESHLNVSLSATWINWKGRGCNEYLSTFVVQNVFLRYIDDLAQKCSNSIANALGLLQYKHLQYLENSSRASQG